MFGGRGTPRAGGRPRMTDMRVGRRSWSVGLALVVLPIVAYPFLTSAWSRAGTFVALDVAGLAAVIVAIWRAPRTVRWVWSLMGGALALWLCGYVFWWWQIVGHGTSPEAVSLANGFFLAGDGLIVLTLCVIFLRRAGLGSLLEAGVIAIQASLFIWVFVVHDYVHGAGSSDGTLAVTALFALFDVVLLSLGIRLLPALARDCACGALLVLGVIGSAVSDSVWSASALTGAYVPGSWADLGWLLFPVLTGLAALQPAARSIAAARDARDEEAGSCASSPCSWQRRVPGWRCSFSPL